MIAALAHSDMDDFLVRERGKATLIQLGMMVDIMPQIYDRVEGNDQRAKHDQADRKAWLKRYNADRKKWLASVNNRSRAA